MARKKTGESQDLEDMFKRAGKEATDRLTPEQLAELVRELIKQRDTASATIDYMQRKLKESRANATIDTKTGTLNDRGLKEVLTREFNAMLRNPGQQQMGVLLLDYDDFKSINTSYTHAGGDACLADVGHRLNKSARVNSTDYVTRYGGDEFMVLFTKTNEKNARHAADSLSQNFLNSGWGWGGQTIPHRATFALVMIDRSALVVSGREVDVDATWKKVATAVSQGLLDAKKHKDNAAMYGKVNVIELSPAQTASERPAAKPRGKTPAPKR